MREIAAMSRAPRASRGFDVAHDWATLLNGKKWFLAVGEDIEEGDVAAFRSYARIRAEKIGRKVQTCQVKNGQGFEGLEITAY